jgi:GrpB-like predicted nucleotidyltransferase (UPF0157 family)
VINHNKVEYNRKSGKFGGLLGAGEALAVGPDKTAMETLEQKVARVVKEEVAIELYDSRWPEMFMQEKLHLQSCLPIELVKRIEHFGSTAVPGLSAKPIIDILVEVSSLDKTKEIIVPILESQGYDYFWRPSFGDNTPPFYAWFIKRNNNGNRTHHIHMVEAESELWDRLGFRNYLIKHPIIANEYSELKIKLSKANSNDRAEYTKAKTDFIVKITKIAKKE